MPIKEKRYTQSSNIKSMDKLKTRKKLAQFTFNKYLSTGDQQTLQKIKDVRAVTQGCYTKGAFCKIY